MAHDDPGSRRPTASEAATAVEPLPAEEPTVRRGESPSEPRESRPDGPGWEEVTPESKGRYRVERERGRGGQARVLVAWDRHMGREVAWKELLSAEPAAAEAATRLLDGTQPEAEGYARRFLREARITAQLEHPNIVPVYEIGRRADGRLYYTMRLFHGETLGDKLARCKTLAERLAYLGAFWDACNAIAYAHGRGVIHRDLKPDNIMVGEFGQTVVLDWGLAKARGADELADVEWEERRSSPPDPARLGRAMVSTGGQTIDGSALGTPWYMSPEQAVGRVDAVDERSDVWGLGAVLYEILTGRPPHDGENAADVLSRVLVEPVRPVTEVCPEAPAELAGIAGRCLAREKASRYEDAREVAADVSAYMTGGRVRAHEYTAWELLGRFGRRHKAGLVAAIVVALVIVAALIALSVAWRDESQARAQEAEARLQAEFHLAQGYVQEARRRIVDGQMHAGRILALASLLHNPAHPRSSHADAGFERRVPQSDRVRMEALSVVARSEHRRFRGLRRTFVLPNAAADARISPDGSLVAASDAGGMLLVWDALTGAERMRGEVDPQRGGTVAFSPDGRRVAAGGWGAGLHVWALDGGGPGLAAPGLGAVQAAAWSPDGTTIVVGRLDGTMAVVDARTGAERRRWLAHQNRIYGLAFLPDGRRVVSGSWDKTARLWDAASGRELARYGPHPDAVYGIAPSPDGRLVATSCYDARIRLWDADTARLVATLEGARDALMAVAFSLDGRTLVGAGGERLVRAWDVATGEVVETLEAHRDMIRSVAFSSDGRYLLTASVDGMVRMWDWAADDGLVRLRHPDSVGGQAFSPDGARLATGAWDGIVRLWRLADAALLAELRGHEQGVPAVAWSPDGRTVASVSYDGTARLWNADTGAEERVLRGHVGFLEAVAFSPDGGRLATAGQDGTVRVWDRATGAPLAVLRGHEGVSTGVSFAPGGALLASSGYDRTVRVWDLAAGRELRTLLGHDDWVTDVRFSPDGRRLLGVSKDRTGIVWDTATWRPVARLLGHLQWINGAAFTPDGREIATAGDDGLAFLWDAASGRPLLRIDLRRSIYALAISPDGQRVALSSEKVVLLTPVAPPPESLDPAAILPQALAAAGARLDGFTLEPGAESGDAAR